MQEKNNSPRVLSKSVNSVDPSKWEYTEEEMKAFNIDRQKEDSWIQEFQLSGDAKLLERLYLMREPTLRVWARRCSYIGDSEDDVFSDLRVVWQRCISKYKWEADVRPLRTKRGGFVTDENGKVKTQFKRTNFNTFLFTSLRNHISNVNKKRYSKKRLDEDGKPIDKNIRSLDVPIGDDEEGQTLYDTLRDDSFSTSSSVETNILVSVIADGDSEVEEVLRMFVSNPQVKRLSTACNIKHGLFHILPHERADLLGWSDSESGKWVEGRILAIKKFSKMKLLNFSVFSDRVEYEILVKDIRLIRKVKAHIEAAKSKI